MSCAGSASLKPKSHWLRPAPIQLPPLSRVPWSTGAERTATSRASNTTVAGTSCTDPTKLPLRNCRSPSLLLDVMLLLAAELVDDALENAPHHVFGHGWFG